MRARRIAPAAAVLTVGLLTGCTSGGSSAATSAPTGGSTGAATQGVGPTAPAGGGDSPTPPEVCDGKTVPDVVSHVEPSVVTVQTGNGLGSGVVYRPHIILTDQHVVARNEGQAPVVPRVSISLADGTQIPGKVIGSDLLTDLAVVKVKRTLSPLPFSHALPRPGQTVMAVGSPLGFRSSVTKGIVSALGRDLPSSQSAPPLVDLIQTDAPISPGNSGGALIDLCGTVVGINEAYISPKSGAVALGFATPSVVATRVADQLIATGSAKHPYLGVEVRNLTPQIAASLQVDVDSGAVVVKVLPGTPAAAAGLERGDVITVLDGRQVHDYADLLGALRQTKPGESVTMTVHRGGEHKTLTVKIAARES